MFDNEVVFDYYLCSFQKMHLLFWKFDFLHRFLLQVAAPAANAALLAGLVANLSTETVPVRGSMTGEHLKIFKVM